MTLIKFFCNRPSIPKDHDAVTLHKVIEQIQRNFSSDKEKVDEDDIFNDTLAYYRDSKFDARKELGVRHLVT